MHIMIFRKSIGLLPIIALIVIIIIRNTNNYCCLLLSSRANRCAHCSSCFDPYWTSGYCCLYLQVSVHESLYRPRSNCTSVLHQMRFVSYLSYQLSCVHVQRCETLFFKVCPRLVFDEYLSAHYSLMFYPLRQIECMGLMRK